MSGLQYMCWQEAVTVSPLALLGKLVLSGALVLLLFALEPGFRLTLLGA